MKQGASSGRARLSNMQWYLAEAENTVHTVLASSAEMDETQFRTLVAEIVRRGPTLGWRENRATEELVEVSGHDAAAAAHYAHAPRQTLELSELDATLAAPFDTADMPHVRASCFSAASPNAQGVRSWLVFETSHAITEGSDISKLLRGRTDADGTNAAQPKARWRLGEALALAMVPPLLVLHLLAAWSWTPRRADFRFKRLVLSRAGLAQAAKARGLSQRALLFGMVSHGMLKGGPKAKPQIAFSTLPRERLRLDGENMLNVRIEDFRTPIEPDLEAHLTSISGTLGALKEKGSFTQIWQNKLQGLHRRLYRWVPKLYPTHFFDFSPYDLLLSLLPPVRPGASWAQLEGTTVFAGSNTGSYPTCIFCLSEDAVTLNFWVDAPRDAGVARVLENARALGIAADDWSEAAI